MMQALPQQLLPESMQELADIIGLPNTLLLIDKLGGTRLYVPYDTYQTHRLAQLIDSDAYARLVKRWAGSVIEMPRCVAAVRHLRERAIAADIGAGMGTVDVARKYHLTERGVRYIKQRLANNHQQQDFFDE